MFRVDASTLIGSGHLMRCLTLAQSLQAAGVETSFICRDLPGNLASWLKGCGQQVDMLPAPPAPLPRGSSEYLSWLAVPMEMEIAQSKALLAQSADVDWVVVDHYALDAEWERQVPPAGASVLAIDDIANRQHACQLLLDQNHYHHAQTRYAGLAGEASFLLGPQYALLRPDFAACRELAAQRGAELRRLLVFLGGSDVANVTANVLRGLGMVKQEGLEIEVIVGQANPHRNIISALCNALGAHLLLQVDDMARRMARADLSIGATGVATWERAALGLPTLAVSVADNQREIARYAHELGILRWLGDAQDLTEQDWTQALQWALGHPSALREQSARGMQLVDGLGAPRVVENMLGYHSRLH